MANLTETANYDEGVRQLETSELFVGGAGGNVENRHRRNGLQK